MYDVDSFVDNLYVIFNQSYMVNAIEKYIKDSQEEFTSKNKPRVLEIGCFTGRLRTFITQQRIFVNYTGIDVRQDYIDNHTLGNRKSVKMLCEDVTDEISVESDSVDVCVCSEVLEHIDQEKYPRILENIHRVLKDGGKFIVGFPMNTKERTFHYPERETGLGHVNFPVYEDFIALAQKKGLHLETFDSSYSVKSSYRMSKEVRQSSIYKKIRGMLGAPVARALMMTLEEDHTGGGFFTFVKR